VVDRSQVLDLLDDIRAQFPVELAEAQKLLSARAEYIASARREAELIRQQAEEKAKQLIAEDQILSIAKQRGNEMLRQAEDRSRELRKAANDYCEDIMRRTEEAMAEAYDEIKKSRARFRAAAGVAASPAAPAPGSRPIYDAAADED
jgi:Skp family chaperone for outer membrane proteins